MVGLTASDLDNVAALVAGSGPHSLALESVGKYRVQAVTGPDGAVEITGLPLEPIDDTLRQLAAVKGAVLIGGTGRRLPGGDPAGTPYAQAACARHGDCSSRRAVAAHRRRHPHSPDGCPVGSGL